MTTANKIRIALLSTDCLHCVVVFVAVMSVYLWSMPKTVVLDDDGYFIMAAYLNVYAHPPGYPLYCLLGKLATLVPLGSIAFRVHALSAVFGALACNVFWYLARYLSGNTILAYIAAFGLAISRVFWSQAIVAEVYSLNVLLFLLIFFLLLQYADTGRAGWLRWGAFLYGMSLSNHWPLLILSSGALLALLWPVRKKLLNDVASCVPFLLLGLIPYVWMIFRSQAAPELNFDGPFTTWPEFWVFITRADYSDIDISQTAGWQDKLQFLIFVIQLTLRQYSYAGGVFILAGFVLQWRVWPLNICIAMLLGYLGNTVFLILLLGFDFDIFHQITFQVYPHIAFTICGLWLALGLVHSMGWLVDRLSQVRGPIITYGLISLVLVSEFVFNAPVNFRSHDAWSEDYARVLLKALDTNAVLYGNANSINGPAGYLNLVEGVRPDITLYSGHSIQIEGKLHRLYKHNTDEIRRLTERFLLTETRPIYYTDDLPHNCAVDDYGLYSYIDTEQCDRKSRTILRADIMYYLRRLVLQPVPLDPWQGMHMLLLRSVNCRMSLSIIEPASIPGVLLKPDSELKLACGHYHGLLIVVDYLLHQSTENWTLIEELLNQAERLRHTEAFTKEDSSRLDYSYGEMWRHRKAIAKAEIAYQSSIRLWNHHSNPAHERLHLLPASSAGNPAKPR